jgi:hypothetical protein
MLAAPDTIEDLDLTVFECTMSTTRFGLSVSSNRRSSISQVRRHKATKAYPTHGSLPPAGEPAGVWMGRTFGTGDGPVATESRFLHPSPLRQLV